METPWDPSQTVGGSSVPVFSWHCLRTTLQHKETCAGGLDTVCSRHFLGGGVLNAAHFRKA